MAAGAIGARSGFALGAIDLIPIIETARGIEQIGAILAAATRVRRVAFGAGDFTLDVNMAWSRERDRTRTRPRSDRHRIARGRNRAPLDTVWVDLDRQARAWKRRLAQRCGIGFQGKMCIHPARSRS